MTSQNHSSDLPCIIRENLACYPEEAKRKTVGVRQGLYHVVASKEGVDGIQVVVEELRHTVDDIEGDGLQDVHHLHVLPCEDMKVVEQTSFFFVRFFLMPHSDEKLLDGNNRVNLPSIYIHLREALSCSREVTAAA